MSRHGTIAVALPLRHGFARSLPALLTLALACTLAFTMMGSFSTLQESAKAELGLSDYRLGLVQGVATAVPLLLLSMPIGLLVDRYSRVRILFGLALIWTAGTFLTAFARDFETLFVARMMTSIGMTGGLTAALSLAADLCAPAERGRATLVVTLGKTLGQAAGFALVGTLSGLLSGTALPSWIGTMAPWRGAHLLLGIGGAVLILPLLLLREPPRGETEAGPRAPLGVVARELWARRAFLGPLFAGQVSIVMADAAALIWAAPVLSRSYGLQPAQFAAWMGLLLLATGLLGAVVGGFSADIGHRSNRRGGLLIGAVVAAAIGIPAALFPISPTVPVFAVALGTLMLCGTVTRLIISVALTVMLPNEVRGLCIGAFISIAGLVGFGVAPTLTTLVSGWLGGEAHLGQALAIVGVIVSSAGLGGFWLAMRRAPEQTSQTGLAQPIG